jgi:hypothetical protein
MSAAMNVNGQHEFHPDAELLSAFAEQALGERERGEVLEHLAVCGRCRHVVALASEAAGAEVAARRHAPVRPRVWFRSWGLALAPAAAIAASAVIAIYVHERDVERNAEVARVERQQATEKAPMPPQASPQPLAQAAPPTAAGPAEKPAPTERAGAARRAPQEEPVETAAAPPPEAANVPLSSREEPAAPAAEAQGPDVRTQETTGAGYAPTGTSPGDKTESDVALYDKERKRQAEAEMEARDKRLFAAKEKTMAGGHGSESGAVGSGTAGSSEQVVVSNQQLETQPAPATSAGAFMRFRAGGFSGIMAPNPVHLPSGLPAISIAHAGLRMLAIDNAGALFFSEDSGANWEPVTKQWTGRAVLVRRDASPKPEEAAPQAGKSEDAGDTSGSGAVSHPDTVFEIVNDQGQVWLSTDGKIWAAR